jgi:hypothetical protein
MAREQGRVVAVGQRGEPLPAPYWTRFEDVRWPGSPGRRIDEVLVGPSGVHVVAHRGGTLPSPTGGQDLHEAAGRVVEAACAVAGLLPGRYRHVVTPAVCLTDTADTGLRVGDVFAASPGVLRHAWRHQARVLSTSEAEAIVHHLRAGLEPFPRELPSGSGPGAWRRRLWVAGAVAAAGAAVGVAATSSPLPLP